MRDPHSGPAAATPSAAANRGGVVSSFASDSESLPEEAYRGSPLDGQTNPAVLPGYLQSNEEPPPPVDGPPLPLTVFGPWKPPGIAGPWPEDEFIFDGGDQEAEVRVRDDWRIDGLDQEDTIAHYDTLDGRTLVTESNRVCLYAPRFAAVRRVDTPFEGQQLASPSGVLQPLIPAGHEELLAAADHNQPVQALGDIGLKTPLIALARDLPLELEQRLRPEALQDRLKPYENSQLMRAGVLVEAEKPFIAKQVQAAITWTRDQAVQIELERVAAVALTKDQALQATYTVDLPNHPQLRICKIASTPTAQPGDIVEFTLRFDNVGDQTIGNVTIVDNLTTRLEYVPDTAKSSLESTFSSRPNEGDSQTLRWEIANPLRPGDGGLVRFHCRVR